MNSSRWVALIAVMMLGIFLGLGKVALMVYQRLRPVVVGVSPSPSPSRSPEIASTSSGAAEKPSSSSEVAEQPSPPVSSPSEADTPPVSSVRPKIRYTATNPPVKPPLKLNHVQQGREFDVYLENLTTCPMVARVDFVQQRNSRARPPLPRDVALRGKQKLRVTTISGASYYDAFSFRYNVTRWMVGIPNARHAPEAVYQLPFAEGSSYRLTVARDSVGPTYNWDVPEDTPVMCARRGKVVYTEQRYGGRSEDWSYFMKTNRVVVLHQDNTLGYYDHLRPQGVAVAVGQGVEPGTLLGYSGETGVCRGPCLTFFVLKAVNAASFRTFELRFDVEGDGEGIVLRNGSVYTTPAY